MKDPAYDDTRYVVDLVAAGVVNTMPEATLDAVADHGRLRGDTVRGCRDEARAVLDALAAAGIDYHQVVTTLEEQGVAKFAASGTQLATALAERLRLARMDRPAGHEGQPRPRLVDDAPAEVAQAGVDAEDAEETAAR